MGRGNPDEPTRVLTVTELTRLIKGVIERQFPAVWVEGELSNVRRPSSGHCYFTIKDEAAQLRAVIWRSDLRTMRLAPKDGVQVRAFGDISVYERDGSYQIIVRRMEAAGLGALQAAFEALKKKLAEEGLFEASRKRPIPLLPQHVGVVTSPTGAAIRDILNVLNRRFPNLHVVVAPARVQGVGAAEEIAAAIDVLNARGGLDVLIVGRGGGSLEDLWCFNEELVARAIARSRIPVISAVGHETDFTISDFVADLRAPTPSAAAELVVGRKDAFEEALDHWSASLVRALREALLEAKSRFTAAAGSYVFREPGNLVRIYRQRIETLRMRGRHELASCVREAQQRADDASLRMSHAVRTKTALWIQHVGALDRQLAAFNPLAVLQRGYSVTRREDGRIVRRAGDVRPGQRVTTRVAKGEFESEVTEIHDDKKEGR
jgi:exodeoxyribonuclease VII large subunit